MNVCGIREMRFESEFSLAVFDNLFKGLVIRLKYSLTLNTYIQSLIKRLKFISCLHYIGRKENNFGWKITGQCFDYTCESLGLFTDSAYFMAMANNKLH